MLYTAVPKIDGYLKPPKAMNADGILRTGTSNIILPGTKKDFPEEYRAGSRLRYYASIFNSLEINSTFYKLPLPSTFEKWSLEVPDDFQFSIKLSREITHRKNLEYNPGDIDTFFKASDRIGKKKGCLLIQFPASISFQYRSAVEKIIGQAHQLNAHSGWRLCVEFRNTSWYDNDFTYGLLDDHNASIVLHDMPESRTPFIGRSLPVVYLRFHGLKGDYRGSYSNEHLLDFAQRIREWLKEGKDVYAYFNNTIGEAFSNARFLHGAIVD